MCLLSSVLSIYVSYPVVMYIITFTDFFCVPIDFCNRAANTLHAASFLAYDFGAIVAETRKGGITLKLPQDFPVDLNKFRDESIDFTKEKINNGNGLCFKEIMAVIELNKDIFMEVLKKDSQDIAFNLEILNNIIDSYNGNNADLYLSVYRCYKGKISCVYGIVKDV